MCSTEHIAEIPLIIIGRKLLFIITPLHRKYTQIVIRNTIGLDFIPHPNMRVRNI